MARVTVEDCLDNCHDQFALVHLATLRYRQLHRGGRRLVDCKNKDIVAALREIAAGKVHFREDVGEVIAKHKRKLISQRLQSLSAGGFTMPDLEEAAKRSATPLI